MECEVCYNLLYYDRFVLIQESHSYVCKECLRETVVHWLSDPYAYKLHCPITSKILDYNRYIMYALPEKQRQWQQKKRLLRYYDKMERMQSQKNVAWILGIWLFTMLADSKGKTLRDKSHCFLAFVGAKSCVGRCIIGTLRPLCSQVVPFNGTQTGAH